MTYSQAWRGAGRSAIFMLAAAATAKRLKIAITTTISNIVNPLLRFPGNTIGLISMTFPIAD
jgi:hypothetical protein